MTEDPKLLPIMQCQGGPYRRSIWSLMPTYEGCTFGHCLMFIDFLFFEVAEDVADESDGLFLHEFVHVFLSDFEADTRV